MLMGSMLYVGDIGGAWLSDIINSLIIYKVVVAATKILLNAFWLLPKSYLGHLDVTLTVFM